MTDESGRIEGEEWAVFATDDDGDATGVPAWLLEEGAEEDDLDGLEEGEDGDEIAEEDLLVEETEEEEEAGEEEEEEAGEEEAEDEEDEEQEASLDELLREQFAGAGAGEENEEDEEGRADVVTPGEEPPRPRGADEFVCRSCFLVKHRRQLADPVRLICKDCADPS